jgi:hypothetical protein
VSNVSNLSSYADLATAAGTLVLAVATFRAVRSANRAARVAEQALLLGLRPLLVPSRLDDTPQKILYGDSKIEYVQGGRGAAEVDGGNVYLAISLRNAGRGIGVLHGWRFMVGRQPIDGHPPLDDFHPHNRDILIAPNDIGFWQAAFREPDHDPQYGDAIAAVRSGELLTIDVLYGDAEGGQRAISRFTLVPRTNPDSDERSWIASAVRHWNIDRPDPRHTDRPDPLRPPA